jgi:hypothetical protein
MVSSSEIFTHDLLSEVRRNPQKAAAIQTALARLDKVTSDIQLGKASSAEVTEAQAALIPLCGFNFGLLIPYYFPRYPLDEPLSLLARPFMFAMTCLAPDSVTTLRAGRQVGKCVVGETTITTDKLGDISIAELFDLAKA